VQFDRPENSRARGDLMLLGSPRSFELSSLMHRREALTFLLATVTGETFRASHMLRLLMKSYPALAYGAIT